ncbi:MAG: malonyl-CoA synthase [Halioglobus sp.]|nr:malonyl-CoA synthase [Halioglobus sp.]|tara:strand:- start:1003 stop:2529 length:1527 start_codon:yes stop_codon:yes gene_type:complete
MPARQPLNLYAAYAANFPGPQAVLLTAVDGREYTYADAEAESARVANLLCELGLQPGDRVTVQVEKSPQNLFLFLGVLRAGMTYHPLNTAYTDDELAYFLADAAPSLVVCDSTRYEALRPLCASANVRHLHTLDDAGAGSLADLAGRCPARFETHASDAGDVAALVYSSGTTGRPKGIMLTHGNLESNASTLAKLWGFSARDCLLHALPVFHVHGLFVAIGCVLMSGASMRWLPRFDVEAVLAALPHSSVMMGVPTYYTRLLADARFDAAACASMRLFVSGSAPLLADTFHAFEARTGQRILERYGMTETGMNTSNPLQGERRAGTVGPPLPDVAVRICAPDGRQLPRGEVGDIQVRGPNVFAGYWNMPDKTAEDFTADGYFVTGDKGLVDDQGYVAIVGRAKDMIISGGLNVYPKEVEQVIDALPGVLESAVIGLPDADFGECVAAVVVTDGSAPVSAGTVRDGVRETSANFKVPKHVFLVDELPRNTMGKVRKDLLRRRFAGQAPS